MLAPLRGAPGPPSRSEVATKRCAEAVAEEDVSTCSQEESKVGTENAAMCVPEVLVIRSAVDKPE